MNYDCGYMTEIEGLLDMVARRCPEMMKQGGGGLSESQTHNGVGLNKCEKTKIVIGYKRGLSLHAIAFEIGIHYNTVVRHTRHLRNCKNPVKVARCAN